MMAIGKKLQKAGPTKGPSNDLISREYQLELANATAAFTKKLTMLTEAERKQISSAFPKLQPFFSGNFLD
jgi:hypothetical protein